MRQLSIAGIALLIAVVALIFLWSLNPLYAFVAGVVFVVLIGIALAFSFNKPRSSAPLPTQIPRAKSTQDFRQAGTVNPPEDGWDGTSKPKAEKKELTPEEEALYEETLFIPEEQERFYEPGSNSQPIAPPAPPPPPQTSVKGGIDDETEEEPVGFSQPEPEPEQTIRKRRQEQVIETEPVRENTDAQKHDLDDELNEDDEVYDGDRSLVRPDLDELGLGEDIDNTDTVIPEALDYGSIISEKSEPDIVEEMPDSTSWLDGLMEQEQEEASEFDDLAEKMKSKMESGTLGDSPEDLENLFQAAFDKAKNRDDDGYGDEIVFSDEEVEEDSEIVLAEIPDWLQDAKPRFGAEPEAPAKPVPPKPAPVPTQTGATKFDLMSMVGELDDEKRQSFFAKAAEIPVTEQTPERLEALYRDILAVDNSVAETQFTAYYPRQAAANTEYGFYVYAHLPDALIGLDIQSFQKELGGRVPKPRVAEQTSKIKTGATLGVMLQSDKLTFNQVGSMKEWQAPFVRFDFKFTTDETLVDEFVDGRIAILLGMIEIASIDFKLLVTEPSLIAGVDALPQNPANARQFEASASVTPYQKIFVSYSHKDTEIAEQYRKVQMMAGNTIFMDTYSIRAGEDWEIALKRFIDEADIFQLLWSEHSCISDHVRFEWDYALKHRCPDNGCIQYIRPSYWKQPMPDVPVELKHLHFAYIDFEKS